MSMRDFVILSKIGEGAYSLVYKVKRHSDGQQYALKKVKMGKLSQKEKENALNEVRILASIDSKSIIGYKEAFLDDQSSSLCLVMELADDGDLYQKIIMQQKSNQLIPEKEIWMTLISMTRALNILHAKNIFHRDLKSANVFMNKNGESQLGDLNVSKVAKKGLLYTQTGTPYYASPEVWKDKPYDSKSDIWSLGCVIYEMTTLKPPFRAPDMNSLYQRVIKGAYPEIPKKYTRELSDVIYSMLNVEPNLRPSCKQILQMPQTQKRIKRLFPSDPVEELDNKIQSENTLININGLLNTIHVPQNLSNLTKRLPKSNYRHKIENITIQASQNMKLESTRDPKIQSMLEKYPTNNLERHPSITTSLTPINYLPKISSMKDMGSYENSPKSKIRNAQSFNKIYGTQSDAPRKNENVKSLNNAQNMKNRNLKLLRNQGSKNIEGDYSSYQNIKGGAVSNNHIVDAISCGNREYGQIEKKSDYRNLSQPAERSNNLYKDTSRRNVGEYSAVSQSLNQPNLANYASNPVVQTLPKHVSRFSQGDLPSTIETQNYYGQNPYAPQLKSSFAGAARNNMIRMTTNKNNSGSHYTPIAGTGGGSRSLNPVTVRNVPTYGSPQNFSYPENRQISAPKVPFLAPVIVSHDRGRSQLKHKPGWWG